MEGGLTFTIGKGFGQMLQRIAWERLTEKLSPRAAVEIITHSLPGCTEGMAVDILDGKITLGEDEATLYVTGTPGAGGKFNDWIRAQRVLLEEEAKEWVEVLERLRQTIADQTEQGIQTILDLEQVEHGLADAADAVGVVGGEGGHVTGQL